MGRPHWHSGPNQPLCGPITLRQRRHQVRSSGWGGLGILEL